jgi:hypothetical protein
MSLILRKKCQTILDGNDVDFLHADIDPNGLFLRLVTECGKPIVTIHGVTFSRKSPTNAEVEYAVELLDAFMVKHGDKLREYVKLSRAATAMEDTPLVNEDKFTEVSRHCKQVEAKVDVKLTYSPQAQLILYADDDHKGMYFQCDRYADIAQADLPLIAKVLKKYEKPFMAMYADQLERYAFDSRMSAVLGSLTHCDI